MTATVGPHVPRAESAARPNDLEVVLRRLDRIEDQLQALAGHTCHHCAPHTAGILVGWREISRYLRKSPRTLRRYVEREGLPVMRWGRHVVSTPSLIDGWLLARDEVRGRVGTHRPIARSPRHPQGPRAPGASVRPAAGPEEAPAGASSNP